MYGKKQWRGREVEGRYSDIMTWFVRELEYNENGRGALTCEVNDFPHYYFTEEYMLQAVTNQEDELAIIRLILDYTNNAVTIEANESILSLFPPDLVNRCHIIYRIKDKNVQALKATDTVSIDAGWYRVHQITKLNMMEITPDDYKFDEKE